MKLIKRISIILPFLMLSVLALTFSSCTQKDVEGGVTYNGNIAIDCDEEATEVTLREGTVGIASGAFVDCSALTKITIPDSVSSIMQGAFKGCDALFDGQDSIKYADNWVIYADTDIENAVIKDGTVGIAYGAFSGCHRIKTFTAPTTVKHIGKNALYGANEISEITLPFIGSNASSNKYIGYLFGAIAPSYNPDYVPKSLKKITLTNEKTVAKDCFSECDYITSVTLSDATETIGEKAFYGCTGLSTVTMTDSVKTFGSYAFAECHSIISFAIPKNITTLPLFVFKGCISLTEITVPESVTSLEACAFANCANLISITLPESLESIGQQTFDGCNKLSYIEIPSGKIGKGAFNECASLSEVVLGEGVTEILDNAFFSCISLKSINFPTTLTVIGEEAFCYCPFATITLPDNLVEIGANAFNNCKELTNLKIPDSVTKIGANAFFNCINAITTIDHVDYIDGWIVSALPAVTYVVIYTDVRGIVDSAFVKCTHISAIYINSEKGVDAPVINNVGAMNSNFELAKVYYHSKQAAEDGWRYVDGIPTPW